MKIKDISLSAAYVGQRVVKAICVGAQEIWSAEKYDQIVETENIDDIKTLFANYGL